VLYNCLQYSRRLTAKAQGAKAHKSIKKHKEQALLVWLDETTKCLPFYLFFFHFLTGTETLQ
jgi:hypothetical protein